MDCRWCHFCCFDLVLECVECTQCGSVTEKITRAHRNLYRDSVLGRMSSSGQRVFIKEMVVFAIGKIISMRGLFSEHLVTEDIHWFLEMNTQRFRSNDASIPLDSWISEGVFDCIDRKNIETLRFRVCNPDMIVLEEYSFSFTYWFANGQRTVPDPVIRESGCKFLEELGGALQMLPPIPKKLVLHMDIDYRDDRTPPRQPKFFWDGCTSDYASETLSCLIPIHHLRTPYYSVGLAVKCNPTRFDIDAEEVDLPRSKYSSVGLSIERNLEGINQLVL